VICWIVGMKGAAVLSRDMRAVRGSNRFGRAIPKIRSSFRYRARASHDALRHWVSHGFRGGGRTHSIRTGQRLMAVARIARDNGITSCTGVRPCSQEGIWPGCHREKIMWIQLVTEQFSTSLAGSWASMRLVRPAKRPRRGPLAGAADLRKSGANGLLGWVAQLPEREFTWVRCRAGATPTRDTE
jgi:hypothetical protein